MPRANRYIIAGNIYHATMVDSGEEFRAHFNAALDEAIIHDELKRQENWTAAVAVGSQGFVEAIERRIRTRQRMEAQPESGRWTLREDYARGLWLTFRGSKRVHRPILAMILFPRACLKNGWNGLPARLRRQLAAEIRKFPNIRASLRRLLPKCNL